jgi:hypothetical protein
VTEDTDLVGRLVESRAKTVAARTARFRYVCPDGYPTGGTFPVAVSKGVLDLTVRGAMVVTQSEGENATSALAREGPSEAVNTGDALYVRWPKVDSQWIRHAWLEPSTDGEPPATGDIWGFLDLLFGVVTAADLGEASVGDIPVARIRATVDLRQAADHVPSDAPPLAGVVAAHDVKSLQVDVFLDDFDRVRRVAYDQSWLWDAPPATTTLTLFDFGVAVDLSPPAGGDELRVFD